MRKQVFGLIFGLTFFQLNDDEFSAINKIGLLITVMINTQFEYLIPIAQVFL